MSLRAYNFLTFISGSSTFASEFSESRLASNIFLLSIFFLVLLHETSILYRIYYPMCIVEYANSKRTCCHGDVTFVRRKAL